MVALFVALSLPMVVSAQDTEGAETSFVKRDSASVNAEAVDSVDVSALERLVGFAETVLDALTIEGERYSLALYPAASYSGRSGLAIGVMPMIQLHSDALPKPATITPSVLVSTKRMFEVQCDVDLFLPHDWNLTAKFELFRQPDDVYAVGNESDKRALASYLFRRTLFNLDALKGIGNSARWQLGSVADVDCYDFSSVDVADAVSLSDSLLAHSMLSFAQGGNYGLGVVAGFDTRDNVLAPQVGWYARARAVGYADIGDNGHRFALLTLDARKYFALGLRSVLACQLYASSALGSAPFTKLPSCGGTRLGRAIGHSLKYVDRAAWLTQVEWRVPVFWRIGATAFGAVGNVCHDVSGIFDSPHLMCGAGLRFAVFPGKGLNLRLDAGLSSKGDHAIYFNIREAF